MTTYAHLHTVQGRLLKHLPTKVQYLILLQIINVEIWHYGNNIFINLLKYVTAIATETMSNAAVLQNELKAYLSTYHIVALQCGSR